MEIQSELIKYIRILAPIMTPQDIYEALLKPNGTILYDPTSIKPQSRNELLDFHEIPDQEATQKSKEVLDQLQEIVKQWSMEIAYNEKNINKDQLKFCSAILLPYGSILLGVANSKSDIDLVCIAPEFIDRHEHFFQGLFEILAKTEGMEQINKIESTFNPIIKMIFKGIHIDVNFAQLNCDIIPDNIDDHLDELRNNLLLTEERSISALNGRKNGILIRKSISNNQEQFIETLKIVKLWSKMRQISSNIIGYLGGISWAILVSKICQLFPGLNSAQTFDLFFQIYSLWNWKMPVIIDDSDVEIKQFSTQCWRDDDKKNEFMKIITPAYPFFNSTFKVSQMTFNTIYFELKRGAALSGNITEILNELDFFEEFKFYTTLSIVGKDAKNFHKWSGFCEAQIPKLLKLLNNQYEDYELRITPNGMVNIEKDYLASLTYFIGIKKLNPLAWPLFLRVPITNFAIELQSRKNQNKFNADYNMKIYLSNSEDIDKMRMHSPQTVNDPIEKKVKMEQHMQSAELIKRVSMESLQLDSKEVRSVLDEMF